MMNGNFGAIVFQSNNNLLSKLICSITQFKYSHVFILLDYPFILDIKEKIIISNIKKYCEDNLEIYSPQKDKLSILLTLDSILQQYKKERYGLLQLLNIGISKLLNTNVLFRNGIVCTEVIYMYIITLFPFLNILDKDNITPKQLYSIIVNNRNFKRC